MTEISNPFSSGGGGVNFETRVQALFTAMLLTGGNVPCLPPGWLLTKIKLQGRHVGYETDDFIAFANEPSGTRQAKLLGQIKHIVKVTAQDPTLAKVIAAAWADFNNSNLFCQGQDAIALLTGPLSATDTHDARSLLDDARMSASAEDFVRRTRDAKFFSKKKDAKLKAFRTQLNRAKGNSLSDEELWSFLKSYYVLGFDLDYGSGVLESLARALLRNDDPTRSDRLWERVIHHVQHVNQGSGTLQFSTLPSDILELFASRSRSPLYLSQWLSANQALSPQILTDTLNSQSMFAALLLGKWNAQSKLDQQLFETLSEEPYAETRKQLRRVISDSDSLISARGNVREISSPVALWQSIGNRLLDSDLERFRDAAIDALCNIDQSLQYQVRSNSVESENCDQEYSGSIRAGVADTLAILGSRRDWLSGCTPGTGEGTARVVVRNVLRDADWKRWASLNEVLPSMAEAAPTEFLDAVEFAFQESSNPFQVLVTDARARFYGAPRVYGLIWALETLAWNQEYLIRACLALVKLEKLMDARATTGNAMDSLTRIFLPWLPQTSASSAKKVAAIRSIHDECPESVWCLLLGILPSQGQSSTGTHRPKWRKDWVPKSWEKGVSRKEYLDLVDEFASLAVSIAKRDSEKLCELLSRLDNLPPNARDALLEYLNDIKSTELDNTIGAEIWNKLDSLVAHHRKYPDANWALPDQELTNIEATADLYSPESPLHRNCRLFTPQEHRFYDGEGEFEEQQERLHKKRSDAIAAILDFGGMESLWEFIETVESPDQVGQALADVEQTHFNEQGLKHLLIDDDKRIAAFARAYVSQRFRLHGWDWIESLQLKEWDPASCGSLFSCLPFDHSVWQRAAELLGENESSYWTVVYPAPFQNTNNIEFAVRKFLDHGRPEAAIKCFLPNIYNKKPISTDLAVEALLAFDETRESPHWLFKDELGRLIEALQNSIVHAVQMKSIAEIEWKYILLLDSSDIFWPLASERKLASDPEYFCERVRSAYRGEGEFDRKMSDFAIGEANKAYVLFRDWRIIPGIQPDGTFSPGCFNDWIQTVDSISLASGHLDIAREIVGRVLIHSPQDPTGLWIHKAISCILNEESRHAMRDGFGTALLNSRGVYLDTGGKEESELAEKYLEKADLVENAGYYRLAITLRNLAQSYDRDAL